MLDLVNICKSYKVGDQVTEALDKVSISFRESEFVSVLGPSGCGKTTLLNIIGGLDRYDSGDLIIRGIPTKKYTDRNWDTYRNHSVGFVFQSYNLIPHQNVFTNVELALTLAGVSKKERRKRVLEALEKVGLSDQIYKKPNQMSGGQMQRVAIARAIVNDPEVLLADEPTGALDSRTSVQIMEILKEISKDRLIIMVTHNPDLAEKYSTRIVRLFDGRVISDSNPKDGEPFFTDSPSLDTGGDGIDEESVPDEDMHLSDEQSCAPSEESSSDLSRPVFSDVEEPDDLSYCREALDKFKKIRENKRHSGFSGDEPDKEEDLVPETLEEDKDGITDIDAAQPFPEPDGEDAEKTPAQSSEGERKKYSKGRKKKSSMSFFTALSLSFKNILTKKFRTFITAFAGSIGIIGIALILAISNGVNIFIKDIQRETLSSYPIQLEAEHRDISSIIGSVREKTASKPNAEKEKDTAYSNTRAYDLFNALFADSTKLNNLAKFKAWLEEELTSDSPETEISKYINTVHYAYDLTLITYVRADENAPYKNTSVESIFGKTGLAESLGFVSTAFSSSSYSYSLFDELIPEKDGSPISDLIKSQYDVIYGDWPKEMNEIVLLVDQNNEIPDMAFFTMGIMSEEDMYSAIVSALGGKAVEAKEHEIRFEDLKDLDMVLLLPSDLYTSFDGGVTYTNIEKLDDGNSQMQLVVKQAGIPLKICGVIRAKPDVTATAISNNTTFCYTNLLTDYLIEKTNRAEVIKAITDPANDNRDIFTDLPYFVDVKDVSDEEKIAEVKDLKNTLGVLKKAELYKKVMTTPDDAFIDAQLDLVLSGLSREQIEKQISENYGSAGSQMLLVMNSMEDGEFSRYVRDMLKNAYVEEYVKTAEDRLEKEIITGLFRGRNDEETKRLRMFFVADYWDRIGVRNVNESVEYLSGLDDGEFYEVFRKTADNMDQSAFEGARLQEFLSKVYLNYDVIGIDPAEMQEALMSLAANLDKDSMNKAMASMFDLFTETSDGETLIRAYGIIKNTQKSGTTLADNKKLVGYVEKDSPSSINIYPDTFENKEKIGEIIERYNERQASEEDRIYYTDVVAMLLSGVTTIINAISYVLIAFVSVSLLVSSIMIGIITYISVLERTKEIGILRSIGASKLDVGRVFTAETLIIGFTSGVIGIGVSLLLCLPINAIVHHFTQINTINASIPPLAAVILVSISMILTVIAGIFPSLTASFKDPVKALRTE